MAKIKEFFVRNWTWLLVIPAILMALFYGIRFYVKMLVDRDDTDEDLHKADVKLKQDTEKIDKDEKIAVDNIHEARDNLTSNIDKGDPSAADVMNSMIGVKGNEEKK